MAPFLLEDRDFKGFWMKIWNAGVFVITRSTLSSFNSIGYIFSLTCIFRYMFMFFWNLFCWFCLLLLCLLLIYICLYVSILF